jgi:hypothetical protein
VVAGLLGRDGGGPGEEGGGEEGEVELHRVRRDGTKRSENEAFLD